MRSLARKGRGPPARTRVGMRSQDSKAPAPVRGLLYRPVTPNHLSSERQHPFLSRATYRRWRSCSTLRRGPPAVRAGQVPWRNLFRRRDSSTLPLGPSRRPVNLHSRKAKWASLVRFAVPHKNESYAVVVVTVKRMMTRCVIQSMNGWPDYNTLMTYCHGLWTTGSVAPKTRKIRIVRSRCSSRFDDIYAIH